MVRLKFAIFALAVLLLWIWQIYALAPHLHDRAVEAASVQAARAPNGLAMKIDQRRREFHRAALKVASAPAALAALKNRAEPPIPEKFDALRNAALEGIPEAYRSSLVVGLSGERGAIYAQGSAEPVSDPKNLDIAALAAAGAEGIWQEAFGSIHLFFSFPVAVFDKGEPKVLGNLVLGAPLLIDGLLEASAKESGLGAIALLGNGKIASVAGPEKASVEGLEKALPPGTSGVVSRAAISTFGPFKFPLGTDRDAFGGRAPLWVGSRQAIRSTPYEVIGLATARPLMAALASYQQMALLLFLALLALSVVGLLWLEPRDFRISSRVLEYEPEHDRASSAEIGEAGEAAPAASSADESLTEPGMGFEHPPAPEPSPGDFRFHAAGDSDAQPPVEEHPTASADIVPPSTETPPPQPQSFGSYVEDNQPTMAYPSPLLPTDAFATASHGGAMNGAPHPGEEVYSPDATRVAEIPEELLRASARSESNEPPSPHKSQAKPPSVDAQSGMSDEQHFREVFTEFLSTRQKLGEPADSLTFDRFAQKLRKNREQLIEKYHCRTVRFQVYVKEGRAALKATPIKD